MANGATRTVASADDTLTVSDQPVFAYPAKVRVAGQPPVTDAVALRLEQHAHISQVRITELMITINKVTSIMAAALLGASAATAAEISMTAQTTPAAQCTARNLATWQLPEPVAPVVNPPANAGRPTLKLADFAAPGRSDWATFVAALKACREQRAGRLLLEPRRYVFDDPAIATSHATAHLLLEQQSDLELDGQGAELVFHHITRGIQLRKCQRVRLKNLTIDWDVPLASPGVIEQHPDGKRGVRIPPEWPVTADTPITGLTEFDTAARRWKMNPAAEQYNVKGAHLTAPQTYTIDDLGAGFTPGMQVLVRHYIYQAHAVDFSGRGNADLTFEEITIRQCPGHAFVGYSCDRGFRLSHCRIQRPLNDPRRLITATADGAHFGGTLGDILIEDCEFEYQGDDSINIHGGWFQVAAIKDARHVALTSRWYGWLFPLVDPGSRLDFRLQQNLAEKGTAKVVHATTAAGSKTLDVELDVDLPAGIAVGDFVGLPERSSPRFVIRNNYFHDHRARGMLLQARDGIVEGNRIERVMAAAIQMTTDANYWEEGYGCENIILRRNRFTGCNYARWERQPHGRHMACVNLVADTKPGLSDYPVHRNILLEDNTIEDTPGLAILIASAENVVVRNNTITNANSEPFADTGKAIGAEARGTIMVTRAAEVALYNNTESADRHRHAQGLFVDPATTSGIALTPAAARLTGAPGELRQWQPAELAFTATTDCPAPLSSWTLTATLTAPDGQTLKIPGFWDGARNWKVRFLPTAPGTWHWQTACTPAANAGLDGLSGSLNVQPPAAGEANALYAHGGLLKVSPDKRYLTHTDGTPFFWLGDTWWFSPADLTPLRGSTHPGTPSMYRLLIDTRAAQGYSTVHMAFLGRSGVNGDYQSVFDGRVLPDYWQEIDAYISYANSHGIVPVIGFGFHQGLNQPSLEQLQNLWGYVLARYAAHAITFLICGEYNQAGGQDPVTKAATLSDADTLRIPKMLALGQFIKDHDPYRRAMTVHPWWYGGEKQQAWSAPWYDFIMLQGGHGKEGPPPKFYRDTYARQPAKPLLEGECTYEGIFSFSDAVVRGNAYKAIQCGSFGYTYGAQGLWYPNQSAADTKFSEWGPTVPWWEALARPGAAQLGHLRHLYESLPWWRLTPAGEGAVVADTAATPAAVQTPAPEVLVKQDGQALFVAYFTAGALAGRDHGALTGAAPGARYRLTLADPRTGKRHDAGLATTTPTGQIPLPARPDALDWLLIAEQTAATAP